MTESTIRSYFEEDHDRLDELFKSFRELKRSDYPKAKEAFKQFKFGLQRHIVREEDLLFPIWEQKTGLTEAGPTQVMRTEHRQIGVLLEALHEKVKAQNPESDQEEERLLAVLASHNLKEERILYPAIDKVLEDSERTAIFKAMEEMPSERYEICCGHG
ncbi:MAG TPA: hemerythrin domain-containing protein [Nitrospiraceae bacterium]|jgi:iron-sulfur cluster repair protein YtfE (RIC family)|nr:hemerythrin domain-containing protein [Nitrospiraceae bacterium]